MKIDGRYLMQGSLEQVWDLLTDPQTLQECTPGCKKLDQIGADEFEATMEIGVGPVKGTYRGKIRLTEKEEPYRYKLIVEGSSTVGHVHGEGVLTFEGLDNGETLVMVSGDAHVGGLVAGVGQRLLEGVTKQFMGQFFKCMQGKLAARRGPGSSGEATSA